MCGISDFSLSIPSCYISIEDFAEQKQLDYSKLKFGLGLENMAILDVDEDIITLAAEALIDLLSKNPHINSTNLKRLYVGTESQIDGSKPIASYLLGICNQYFLSNGLPKIEECDVTDQIFACIGAVDAMENCLYWLKQNPNDYAIVIATDHAKYEFDSTGEYTQGAGAIAMLLSSEPTLLKIDTNVGVSSECTHDFFKPVRHINLENFHLNSKEAKYVNKNGNSHLQLHSDCPVFDGPYSNQSYKERTLSAYTSFKNKHPEFSISDWEKIIFHLPFAFQARKVAAPFFLDYLESKKEKITFLQQYDIQDDFQNSQIDKIIRKSNEYKAFVDKRIAEGEIASGQIGNIYSGSIFLSIISMLYYSYEKGQQLANQKIGLIAYGSGAKSKVLEATILQGWKKMVSQFNLPEKLANRTKIDFSTYKQLYYNQTKQRCHSREKKVRLNHVGIGETNYGARNYKYQQ